MSSYHRVSVHYFPINVQLVLNVKILSPWTSIYYNVIFADWFPLKVEFLKWLLMDHASLGSRFAFYDTIECHGWFSCFGDHSNKWTFDPDTTTCKVTNLYSVLSLSKKLNALIFDTFYHGVILFLAKTTTATKQNKKQIRHHEDLTDWKKWLLPNPLGLLRHPELPSNCALPEIGDEGWKSAVWQRTLV